MLYRKTIDVPCSATDAFAYVSDFSRISEWDPGVVESRALGRDAPIHVGSRFEVVALFRGNRQRFEYVVTEFEEGRRIGLLGDGEKARSRDEISVAEMNGNTQITYEADIRLKGVRRAAEPFLGRMFRRMGDDALHGLAQRLGAR
jgi:Polyketide cyclase / dehydrase and lipid transport